MKLKEKIGFSIVCNAITSLKSDQFWYDLKHGHYVHPEDLLNNEEDIKKVQNAIKIISEYEYTLSSLRNYIEETE